MELKHVILRGETYFFRMRVPQDCVEQVGKKEIICSLKTKDPLKAQATAKEAAQGWAARFRRIRTPLHVLVAKKTGLAVADEIEPPFKQGLIDQMEKSLPEIIEEPEEHLRGRFTHYTAIIDRIQRSDHTCSFDLPELGVSWPFIPPISPRQDRQRSRDLIEVLNLLRETVANEMVSPPVKREVPQKNKKRVSAEPEDKPATATTEKHNVMDVAELMIAAKKRIAKTDATIRADIRLLQEWVRDKRDIGAYTKKDLIDFVQNCLPYIPVNITKKKAYEGKSLRECVALTKKHPEKYTPISYITCGNRLVNIVMVFNYAKDQLGVIPINPAKGIEIPKVRVIENGPKGFTPNELTAMWAALQAVKEDVDQRPSRYWATVLGLYHGFRLNEVCSLFLNDVYEDEDGVFVIDVNKDHATKSVKNQSSVRIVPVHPFVRDQLDFKGYVERQKSARTDGMLFPDVSFVESKGYLSMVSSWFAKWKKEWLPAKSLYKHFHDLRYTFTQNAQNIAKMPDRHAQEITGHSIGGVSAVHLVYSGPLKPAALLEELQKVKYGWETVQETPGQ
jgi:integrase